MFEITIQREKKHFILAYILCGILCTLVSTPVWASQKECVPLDVFGAAKKLGVTMEEFDAITGGPGKPGPLNFKDIAQKLGTTEQKVKEAFGIAGGKQLCEREDPFKDTPTKKVVINNVEFNVLEIYQFFTWNELPSDVIIERQEIKAYRNPNGETHYYEVVYVPSANLNWYQAARLAEDAGGYLASISSAEENAFVFGLVSDQKYFWVFPEGGPMKHYGISIGPFLGGYQPEGSPEPAGGWCWLSGEPWTYSNWAVDLNDGVIDKDPRPNTQPNNSGGNQPIMGFGEMNLPVPTWGDYMPLVGTYGIEKLPGRSYGFVIEYSQKP